ncbi:MAG TPA: amidohydrolase family protein [Acidimicrobiales bacterium]|nr:amidohydrolase family protein [Acidimicrobiales bacterium]
MTGSRMVDADGHVTEQLELDPDVSAAFFNRLNGELPIEVFGPANDPIPDEASHAELMNRPGAYEPGARLVDMDADGIDVAVLYPTTPGLGWVPDPNVFLKMSQAYNRWLHDFCSYNPDRLIGVGLVPLQDPGLAVKEMQHCVEDLGFKAVMIRPAPYIDDKPLNDPVYDPFWDAAQALGCPIGVHPFSFADMPYNVVSRLGLHHDSLGDPSKGLTLRQGLGNALDVMVAMGWFVAGGICERYPRLVVAFLEGSGGWCAPMLERFDHHIHVFGSRYQKTLPSEVFKRQCYISFDPDEDALAYTANSRYVGADRIIWASDYPHPDAKIPGIVAELEEATESLSEPQRELIFGANAKRLYSL